MHIPPSSKSPIRFTEMKEIKHAYTKGVEAQRGIEY